MADSQHNPKNNRRSVSIPQRHDRRPSAQLYNPNDDAHSGLDMPPLPVQPNQRTNNAGQGNGHRKSASVNPQDRNRRKNMAPRFQEDNANEGESDSYGTLNPNFQFGAKRRPTTNSISYSNHTPSQSLGGGGFVPGLGMTPEQLLIQQQIEALQHQQRTLIQNQSQFVQQFDQQTLNSRMNPAGGNNHRRIQSQQVPNMRMQGGNLAQFSPQSPNLFNPQGSPQMKNIPPKGHGRRHSVNVSKVTQDLNDFSFPPRNPVGNIPTQGGHGRRISTGQAIQQPVAINNQSGVPDLAQAQSQLASLAQFRVGVGAGGHNRAQSFAFPNAFQNMVAAASLSAALGGNQVGKFDNGVNYALQQQQAFNLQMQQPGGGNGPQRKSLFAPYLPQASLPPLLTAGKLVVGMLRVNKRNRSDAYISTEVLDADVYICGSKDRNRALEGDIVAVELLNVDEVWGTKKEKEEKKRRKEESAQYDALRAINPSIETKQQAKNRDDVEVEGQGLFLIADEEVNDEQKPKYAGHVVAIVERMPGQLFSGTLGILRPSSAATKEKQEAERREREGGIPEAQNKPVQRPKIVWFKPTDKRVPLIAIPTEQAPKDFLDNSDSYQNELFVACIKRWPITSLHPFGTLVEKLGPIGDIEVETSALLKDSNASFSEEFHDSVIKCLPALPWQIPQEEYETRRDLRGERTFTIDPDTAKDLDDAVSVKVNGDGTYDITVSIADVSYFIKPNSPLDKDARKRATSVYLVQRAVPMLPSILSSDLCSLLPDRERLAFSVTFTMNKDAKVLKTWFGRTIIKSCAQLAYANAQNVIDGKALDAKAERMSDMHTSESIAGDIKILYDLSRKLRARRFDGGALKIDSMKLSFQLDDNGVPIDCMAYQSREANNLIEEFMLLSNITVASEIAASLPEQSLLRRHEDPIERRLKGFQERAKELGFDIDISSSKALQKSFLDIEDLEARKMLQVLAVKGMCRAKYFCSGAIDISAYKHYALNVPLYTHFTSPIRRYADVIVHRQLQAVIENGEEAEKGFNMERETIAKIAQQCNIKKEAAKQAQESSQHLYLCLLISDLTKRYGPVVRQATVIGVLDRAFDVLVNDMGIEKRVHVDQIPVDDHKYNDEAKTLDLHWKKGVDVISWLADNSSDGHLKRIQEAASKHAPSHMTSRSTQDEQALFDDDDESDEEDTQHDNELNDDKVIETVQHTKSQRSYEPKYENIRVEGGKYIQTIKERMTVDIIVTADFSASPPILKCYCGNPFA
ncbi:hypothetical protein E3P99_03241 [Wallemia hederae]|uniref:DIS3-like exonuclease 2 n=1 Tax=Wallemia hederae TaxID=1540922 RepID=A0A4T0FG48_9BASI|nr:hypothetical protein E3P99_03241 [Wallemia hederae]